jgi:zinc/manganese transport system permease protein
MTLVIPPFSPNLLQDVYVMLQVDFMRHALLAGTVLAAAAGLIGYFVVLRHLVFAGDALSHVAFTGALGAVAVGTNPQVGLFGVTALIAMGMGVLGERARGRDVAIGTVLAWVLGLGALFLSLYTSRASAANSTFGVSVLFGSIFGLQAQFAQLVTLIGVGVMATLLVIARPLLFASIDPDVAAARGVPVRVLNLVFLVLLAITIGEAVQAVGALLIFALLVTPAAIAHRLLTRPFAALFLSALLAVSFTCIGLAIGFYTPYPVSFLISTLAFITYVTVVVWQRLRTS